MNRRNYNCRTVRDMLPLHVGRDLDPRHEAAVDTHLRSCLVCFREFRDLAAMRGRLGVLAEEPLPAHILDGFTEEVMARVAVGEPGPAAAAPRPGGRVLMLPRLTAAAAVMLVVLAGWRLMHDGAVLNTRPVADAAPVVLPQVPVPSAAGQASPVLGMDDALAPHRVGRGTSLAGATSGVAAPPADRPAQVTWRKVLRDGKGRGLIIMGTGTKRLPSAQELIMLETSPQAVLGLQGPDGLELDDSGRQMRVRQP